MISRYFFFYYAQKQYFLFELLDNIIHNSGLTITVAYPDW